MATPPAGGHPTPASSVIIVFSKHRTARRPRKAPAACARSRHVTLFLHASEGDIPARDSGPSSRVLPKTSFSERCGWMVGYDLRIRIESAQISLGSSDCMAKYVGGGRRVGGHRRRVGHRRILAVHYRGSSCCCLEAVLVILPAKLAIPHRGPS
ncbi:hypothetical protein BHM03_00022188 [Ensete ventricosum]|nr:hypothetical protein BHM03_00022188 [Ensete ventricosum]